MNRLKLILLLALPALLPAGLDAQTFRALNKLEAVGFTLLGSSASVRGELKVATTSASSYLLRLSSGTGLATQGVFAVGNTGNTGVGTASPQVRLHVSSAAGTSGNMVLITTGTSNVIRMTGAGEIYANKYYGDASGLTGVTGDNLGNHIATQDLNMSGFAVLNASSVTLVAPLTGPYSLWASTSSVTPHLYVSTAGRVGFGVASPDDAAHVIGQVRLDNDANTTNKGCFRYNGTSNQLEYSNDCTAFQSFTAASAGGWTDDGSIVRLTTLTDLVGIGTATPETDLDVFGVLQLRRQANATNDTSKNSSILQLQGAYWNGSASTNQVMRLQNVGNYGPGLSSYKLSIQNNAGAEQMCVTSGGNVGVGVTNPGAKLDVNGSIKTSGYYYTGLGAVGTPSYSFGGDATTGIYSPGASQLAITLGGTARWTMTTAANTATLPMLGSNGTVGAPAYSFSGDTDTGIYRPAADQLGFAIGGTAPLTITTSQFTATLPWRGQNGAVGAPAYSFSAETDTGMYRIGVDQLGFATGGVVRMAVNATGMLGVGTAAPEQVLDVAGTAQIRRLANADAGNTLRNSNYLYLQGAYWTGAASSSQSIRLQNIVSSVAPLYRLSVQNDAGTELMVVRSDGNVGIGTSNPLEDLDVAGNIQASGVYYAAAGAVGTPSISFSGDPNTGIYWVAADQMGLAAGGVLGLTVTGTQLTGALPLRGQNGTAAAPAYSFNANNNTGIYSPGADQLGFATAGVGRMFVNGATDISVNLPIRAADGTAAAPSYAFTNDADMGMYRAGVDILGFATAGVARLSLNATGMLGVATTAPETALDVAGTMQIRRLANADAGNTLRNSNYLYLQGAYWNGSASSNQSIRVQNIVSAVTPVYRLSFQNNAGTELMVVRSDGNVGIGTSTPGQDLDVAGNMQASGYIYAAAGAVGTPAYSFTGDTNTGLYRPAAGSLGLAAGGVLGLSLTSTQLTGALPFRGVNGTVGAPAISFSADTDMGLYRPAADTLNFAVTASSRVSITNTFVSANVPFQGYNGTIALPSFGFTSDADTGIYLPAAGQLGVTAGGALRFSVTTADVIPTVQVANTDGTAAAPAYSFSNDNNTGMYRIGTDQLGFATGGAQRFFVGTSSMVFGVRLQLPAGSAAAPAYTFTNDINTGMFYPTADHLSFATAGLERFRIYLSSFVFGANAAEQQFDIAGGNLQVRRVTDATSGATLQNSNKVMLQGAYWNGSASANAAMQVQTIMSAVTPRYRLSVQDNAGNERFVVRDDGLVGVNTGAPAQELDVNGDIYTSGVHLAGAGAVGGPAYSFGADVNTGIYRPGAEQLALVTNGAARLTVVTTSVTATLPIQGANGTVSYPAFTFTGDTNTGMYSPGADQLGFAVNGAAGLTLDTSKVTSAVVWRGPNGTAALPAFSFANDTDSGLYLAAASQLGFAAAGAQRLQVTNSSITASVPLNVPYGSASAPGWAFTAEPNTGIYRSGLGTISFATQGVERFAVGATSITLTVPWRGQNGTAAAPAFSFTADPDGGMFYPAVANHLGFATGGVERFRIYVSSFGFGTTAPEQQFDIAGGNLQMQRIATATSGAPLQNSNKVLLQGSYWNGSAAVSQVMQFQNIVSATTPRYRFSVQDNSGNERFVVRDDGLVGVNTSAPLQALHVNGDAYATGVFLAGNGTVGSPAYAFSAETNTGLYRAGVDQLALVTNGVARMTVVTSSITATLPIQGANGTLAAPAYGFTSDPNTGIYTPGADQLGFVVGGLSTMTITTTQIQAHLPWRGPNGTAALPAYSFASDTNNGIYWAGADILGFATAGVLRASIDATGQFGIGMSTQTYDLQLKNNSAAKPGSQYWTVSSDRRLKKDIKPIERPLEKMLALKGVTYKWKDPSTQGNMTGTYMGFIAQDVEKIFPEWVGTTPDGYKDLNVIGFEGLTAEAVKELRKETEALEALLERQGREIDRLERLLASKGR